ncbi:MAG TPA: antitoxin family protein [Thermoanaerobaculia bacterium]|nr:antitoxin family protein [Thermoanaerobaculia bacterium]
MDDTNPQAREMADESMVRTLTAQAEALWPPRPVSQGRRCPCWSLPRSRNRMAGTTKEAGQSTAAVRVFEAVYEDGVLKPLQDPGLADHHRFSVRVQELGEMGAADDLAAWHRVYAGLADDDLAAVEEIALDRSRFSRRQPE